jgi:hypothetical protein
MTATRRLAAILASDVAGYSRLIGADEEGTLNRLPWMRAEIIGDGRAESGSSLHEAGRTNTVRLRRLAETNTPFREAKPGRGM